MHCCVLPLWPLAHSCGLTSIPVPLLLLLSALQCSNLPVPRLPLCVRCQDRQGCGKTCPSEGHSLQDGYGGNEIRGERGWAAHDNATDDMESHAGVGGLQLRVISHLTSVKRERPESLNHVMRRSCPSKGRESQITDGEGHWE